jgi:pentapeptide MXKDX repeat protein
LVRRTLAGRFGRNKTDHRFSWRIIPKVEGASKAFSERDFSSREIFRAIGNKLYRGIVWKVAASVAFKTGFQRDDHQMTTSTRIALGISAAALSLGLALAPAAFAQDKMGKDDAMKKDSMSKDTMKKDTMSKDTMKKDDGMKKDGMMKKDDGMKK